MELIKVTEKTVLRAVKKCIDGGLHRILYMIPVSPMAFVYSEKQIDKKICDDLGYTVYPAFYNGGTILCNNGDLVFAHFGEPENGWLFGFIDYFVDWLKAKGLNAEFVGNDVLVDGCKVCGTCITRHGRIDYTCCFVCIDIDLDHIKAICKKPMEKVPKCLSEYGITTEEVEKMFVAFCKNNREEN